MAEDGVTTNRYPIQFLLVESGQQLSVAQAPGGGGANASAWRSPGWPLPPAMQPGCSVCPRGWAAGQGEHWRVAPLGCCYRCGTAA